MPLTGFTWECVCGNVEYGEEEPEECMKCYKLASFIKVPEEVIAEREKDFLEEETSPVKPLKIKKRRKKK